MTHRELAQDPGGQGSAVGLDVGAVRWDWRHRPGVGPATVERQPAV